ncbi:MAG: tRNA uridine-5-carboxymethylaminomethyl(34) synthesis GTPase MnmE [Eubacterium sp.]|nr:tRNA uridine-5-carboxymethylaminomethyl(34) synthesis GTPase MnmE [Eubacterium sp.]
MSTIAAISTGNAPGGIGVIRISGADAIKIANSVFECRDNSTLLDLEGYRAKFGSIVIDGQKQDDAVALVFRAPKSYTGEDVAELSVHGGMLSVQKTLEAVFRAGAEPAAAGEFTKRAFLNGKMDLTQAESVADIISAQGEEALKASFSALHGRISKSVNAVLEKLLDASATMAAWVDYPDEEIPEMTDTVLGETLEFCEAELANLLKNYDKGQTVKNGVDTVIAGRPNVGKSSLMNMLTGTDKSIVTHIEGTTRDIVEEDVRLGSIVLHLKDTAGLRESGDLVEHIGIEKAYKALDDARLVLAVFDSSEGLTDEDRELIKRCSGKLCVAVINKTDLEKMADTAEIEGAFDRTVYISAKNDEGLEKLEAAVTSLLGVADFDSTAPLLANARQKQHCENALTSVREALDGVALGITFDAINVMIDAAADELLSLTGKKANAEVVNNIFSKFCVGK